MATKKKTDHVPPMAAPVPRVDVELLLDLVAILEDGGAVSDATADRLRKRIGK